MLISAIFCMTPDGAIGTPDNQMPWHSPRDLKYFQSVTIGHPCIFGRNTYFNMPRHPLKDRLNIVISSQFDPRGKICDGHIEFASIESALRHPLIRNYNEIMICGGASIYKYCMDKDLLDRIYLSVITGADIKYDKSELKYLDKSILNALHAPNWKQDKSSIQTVSDINNQQLTFSIYNKINKQK